MRQSVKHRQAGIPSLSDVASALHALRDVAVLSDSPLCELPFVEKRARDERALFAEGLALQAILSAAVVRVIERLPRGDSKSERIRLTLDGVLEGRSIAQVARENARTREYWSRSYWKQAVALVAKELMNQHI